MRDYGRVYCSFWTSTDVQSMSDDAKLLAVYLLTCSHGTIAGACRLPDGYACEDLGWTPERVSKGFIELFERGFANRCETTKWTWIRKFLEWNQPENPNQWKAARKIVNQIPDQCSWKADFLAVFRQMSGDLPPPASNPSGTVPKPFRNQDQEQYQEVRDVELPSAPQPNGNHAAIPTDVTTVFNHWRITWSHEKAKLDKKRDRAIRQALKSYPVDQLCTAISGYRNSPHHRGENDRSTPFDDVELFLRDAKHIEAGIKLAEKGQERQWT